MSIEKFHCRVCQRAGGRKAFVVPGAEPHYAPDIPYRLEHLLIDVKVDPKSKSLDGVVTQKLKVVTPNPERVTLDQIGIKISDVKLNGEKTPFVVDGHKIHIELSQKLKSLQPDQTFEVSVAYRANNPRRGLYFTGPDTNWPKKRHQVWSQGQDEDNRFWIPTFDYPNQKATTEMIATVPKGFTAVSNGALLSKNDEGGWTRFHYKLGTPHVTYLICLTVAEFAQWEDQGPGGIPVQYFVEPGREEDGKRAFSNTPRMIEAFSKKTGVPYPYEKYSQVAVQDFIFGGMENTSATTQTDLTLHDGRAHLDFSSDPLVSHELAHQWFGDLLTCRDWSHGWLNEGFATFMERVWIECNEKEYGSKELAIEEAKYYSYADLKDYQQEDSSRYRRSIVCNTYVEPIDLFDTHLYQKGGLVLNLIRATLGEDQFWKAVNLYVTRHRGQSVETLDLIRAIEDATGRNLRRFFDEWVFSAGYPELELGYQWHEDKKQVELTIEQKQTHGKERLEQDGFSTLLFHLAVQVELGFAGGKSTHHTVQIGSLKDRLFLHAESKPLMVKFDPGNTIPKSLKFPRPKEMLIYQLQNDTDCMGRIQVIKELIKMPEADVIAALGKAVREDRFWGVQYEAAQALSEIRGQLSRDELIASLKISHPKARRGVVKALGEYKSHAAAQALKPLAQKDPSYFVEAEAIEAYANAVLPVGTASRAAEVSELETFLLSQLAKESYVDVIRGAALRSLSRLPGIGQGERDQALKAVFEWSQANQGVGARGAAISCLGQIARTANRQIRAQICDWFETLSDEENFRTRVRLIAAIDTGELVEAASILEKIHRLDLDGRVKRDALGVRDSLYTSSGMPESVSLLKTALEKLEEEHRKLKATVEELKASGAAASK